MSTSIITTPYRYEQSQRLVDSFSLQNYYLFTADSSNPANSAIVEDVNLTNRDSFIDVYQKMISGKKIAANDVCVIVNYNPYVSNTFYDMYDDQEDLTNKSYFVVVNASSYSHIFKCLDNNNGSNSTIQPDFSDIVGSNTQLYQTSDGYRWKYMYSYSSAIGLKFSTSDYIPLVVNSVVADSAIPGSIEIIKVEDAGRGYNNYLIGTFKNGDVRVDGNSSLHMISTSNAVAVNGYYTGCIVYLTSGTGVGQFRTVSDYIANSTGNFIVVDTLFDTSPTNGTTYEMYPTVQVSGARSETINAIGRALINALASNSVYRVEMLEAGQGYVQAGASVIANAAVGVIRQANVRPILPPRGGHGFDAADELGAQNIIVSVTLANSESNTIPSINQYRRIGIVKDPQFRDVTLNLNTLSGSFVPSENVLAVQATRFASAASVNVGNAAITSAISDWRESLAAGDKIILKSSDSTLYQYLTVNNVVNSSQFYASSNALFTANATAIIYFANTQGSAIVVNASANTLGVTNCDPSFTTNTVIIGESSGAHAIVTDVSRQGVTKGFNTFVQMNKFVGSLTLGTFIPNETVYQNSLSQANAVLHSVFLNSGILTMYTLDQVGSFKSSNTITGDLSTAVMSVSAKYNPELVFGSGTPLYIENLSPIPRTADQSEVFKIVLNF